MESDITIRNFSIHRSRYMIGSPFELLDIMKAQLPNAELAVLSACHGAAVDQSAPNELIRLAALQFYGFRCCKTLWAMVDEDGPTVFYRYMFRDSESGKADFGDANQRSYARTKKAESTLLSMS